MSLKQRLTEELKGALKAREEFRVNALREMLGALRYAELEKSGELTESEELSVLSKLKKRHQESIEAFEKGNRSDLANKEREELNVIEKFLPSPLSAEEISQLVKRAIEETQARGLKEMGKVMSALKDRYSGRADGKVVSEEVKRQLSEMGKS
jgi:uncharacterized protein YqeY